MMKTGVTVLTYPRNRPATHVTVNDVDFSNISAAATKTLETMASTTQSLVEKYQHISSANTATIFPLCPQQQSLKTEQVSQVLIANQPMATVTINGKVWTEDDLPDCVTLNEDKFLQRNAPAHPSDLVDHTQGQAVYLYIDMYGFNIGEFAQYSTQGQR